MVVWKSPIGLETYSDNSTTETAEKRAYRPISLSSVFCKIMKRIINARLQRALLDGNFISIERAGFQQQRSTEEQITYLSSKISVVFSWQQHVLAIFFDLKKAFDTIKRNKSIEQLQKWGFKGHLTFIKQ